MISFENMKLTIGHIARHTPSGRGAPGREAERKLCIPDAEIIKKVLEAL